MRTFPLRYIDIPWSLALIAWTTGCGHNSAYYLHEASLLYAKGHYSDAAIDYRKAIQKEPGSGDAYLGLGLCLSREGRQADAYAAYKQALSKKPGLTEARMQLADLVLKRYLTDPEKPVEAYKEAKQLSADLLARDPRCADCLRIQGFLQLSDRNPSEALASFRKADEIRPAQAETIQGLFLALNQNNQPEEAEKVALGLISTQRGYGLIYDDLYAFYMSRGRADDAERIFQLKVVNNPTVTVYRLQLAAHYSNARKPVEMEATLKPLRDDAATFPNGQVDAARFYMETGNLAAARSLLRNAASSHDSDMRRAAKKLEMKIDVAEGHPADALRILDQLIKEFPKDEDAQFIRVTLLVDSRDRSKASDALQELDKLRSSLGTNPMFWQATGEAESLLGHADKAGAAFRHAASLSPRFKRARISLAELSLSGGKSAAALQYADEALRIDPSDNRARLLRASALMSTRRLSEAAVELTTLVRANPQNEEAQLELALIDLDAKKYADAEAIFMRFYRAGNKDLRALTGLVQVDMAAGHADRAIALLNADLKRSSNPEAVRRLLAQVAMASNDPATAVQQYTEIAKTRAPRIDDYFPLAQALRARGDLAGAVAAMAQAEAKAPNDAAVISMLAFLLEESGKNREAADKFRRVLQLKPGDLNTINNLAFLLAETGGNLDEAQKLAESAAKGAPSNAAYADTLALVYIKKKMPGQALQTMEKLIRTSPDNPEYLYHLAVAQRDNGNETQARLTLEAALGKRPAKPDEVRIRELLGQIAHRKPARN